MRKQYDLNIMILIHFALVTELCPGMRTILRHPRYRGNQARIDTTVEDEWMIRKDMSYI